jgi:hypothetical protein
MHGMVTIESALVIHAPREVVYSLSQDYTVRSAWDKYTRLLEMADGSPYLVRPGARALVRTKFGLGVTMEFTEVDASNRVAMRMVSGPSFLDSVLATWSFENVGERASLARFRYELSLRDSALRGPMRWLVEYWFGKIVLRRLEGLKRYSEHVAKLRSMPPPLRNFTF